MQWIQDVNCDRWASTGKSAKAFNSSVYNTYAAFELQIPAFFVREDSTVEFKYRKDTQKTGYTNGEFKFYVDDEHVLADSSATHNGWQIYKYNVSSTGMHMLYWIYTKWNEVDVSDEMAAEIEVRIQSLIE